MMNFQIASKVREIVYNKDTTYHTKLANREYGHISKKKKNLKLGRELLQMAKRIQHEVAYNSLGRSRELAWSPALKWSTPCLRSYISISIQGFDESL